MIIASGATHPGRVRPANEDAFICDVDEQIFIVCDGMGGHNAGEVASALAVEAIKTFLTRTREGEDVTWPYGIDPKLSFEGNRLMTAIKLANRRVFKAGESREEYTGMGTTVVAAFVAGDRLVFSGVGDSRIYAATNGRVTQITEDDSWIARMLQSPGADRAALEKHPMKHVLTNVVGAREQVEFRVSEFSLDAPVTLLLCSDGLHGLVDPDALNGMLLSDEEPGRIAERLVQAALDGGGTDNITALVVRSTPESLSSL